jgi:anti-sigma B factor antagonist
METQGGVARQESDANALQPFALDSRTECGWTVIDVRGDLDVYTSPTLRHLILDCINRGDSRIIVDLEHVDFLDSAGVSVMVNGLRLASSWDTTLVFVHPGGQVRRMLRLTHLDKMLHTFTTVEDAVSLRPPSMGAKT